MPGGVEEVVLEILASAGVAAEYCAQDENWAAFSEWMKEGMPASTDREILQIAPRIILMIVQGIEKELNHEKISPPGNYL